MSCDTCGNKFMESKDDQGKRIVDCSANDLQIFQPYAEDCKKWVPKPLSTDEAE